MKMKETTVTYEVMRALREADDFMSLQMLTDATKKSRKNVASALWMLRRYRAVDVVINADGIGWWYALPEQEDQRQRPMIERTPESKPRKPGIRKKKQQQS